MYVELKKAPEVAALLNSAQGEYDRVKATLIAFKGPMALDSNWSEGTKTWWTLINLADGRVLPLPESGGLNQATAPVLETLPAGNALIETCYYRGKAMPARIHMNADNLTKLLPAQIELTDRERFVLKCTASYTSAYRKEEFERNGLTPSILEPIKAGLVAKGLLDKRGAITVAGRNAIEGER